MQQWLQTYECFCNGRVLISLLDSQAVVDFHLTAPLPDHPKFHHALESSCSAVCVLFSIKHNNKGK